MNVLVTAGNTLVPIDRVRCITNVFTGRTGGSIAVHAHERGHNVTLLTSHPEALDHAPSGERWQLQTYRTFADLAGLLAQDVADGTEVVIHCAAVSDYEAGGIYAPAPDTRFDAQDNVWRGPTNQPPQMVDRAAAKVKSDEPELWLRLVRAPKLIDRFRHDWSFGGVLVKFKLEVGVSDEQLLGIAEPSRRHSEADLMVANTLEGSASWAFIGPIAGAYERVSRAKLATRLLEVVETLARERGHG